MTRINLPMIFLATTCVFSAAAQTPPTDTWSGVYLGTKVKVVTTAEPKRAQKCHVKSFETDQIVCSRHFGRNPVSYKRGDVAAIIDPGWEPICWAFFGLAGGGVGAITGAILLRSVFVVAVPLGMAGGVAILVSFFTLMEADDGSPPRLLYLKPGEKLQVALR